MMLQLVKCKAGTIDVKEIPEGKCVCIACRGFGTMWNRTYWNGEAISTGGLYMSGEHRSCIKCSGVGHWVDPLQKTVGKFV